MCIISLYIQKYPGALFYASVYTDDRLRFKGIKGHPKATFLVDVGVRM